MTGILSASCPMPKMDFDIITLGHGSGGLLTNQLLDTGVFNVLKNKYLDTRHDGAILPIRDNKIAFTTDSFVITPIFFPGGNIGDLAINGTVNDIAMCGAKPAYLSLSFILEEGLKMTELWEILLTIKKAADHAQVPIVTGDTKVVEKGKGDKIFINTTGIGYIHPKALFNSDRIEKGDAIVVSGHIANHGITIMSQREGLEFESDILSDTRSLHHNVWTVLEEFGHAIKIMRDPTRGGVATVLNELARDAQLGIKIAEEHLPVIPQVTGACELLGLDPLYVANEGLFVAVVDSSIKDAFVKTLRSMPETRDATIIGEVSSKHPGKVVMKSGIGGLRVINMLAGDQLPRIC